MGHDGAGCVRTAPGSRLYAARRERAVDFSEGGDPSGAPPVRGSQMKKQYNFSKAKRGPVLKVPRGKSRITIRLDDDVLDWFRNQVDDAGGGSYQNLINQALRAHI